MTLSVTHAKVTTVPDNTTDDPQIVNPSDWNATHTISGAVDYSEITGKPSTFPPTLPIAQSGVTNLVTDLAAKAPLNSPTFTGTPASVTVSLSDNSTTIATTAWVKGQGYGTGGSFNGGTITNPLTIATTVGTNAELILKRPSASYDTAIISQSQTGLPFWRMGMSDSYITLQRDVAGTLTDTLWVQRSDGQLQVIEQAIYGSLDFDGATGTIINLPDPTNAQDAATKAYADTKVRGVNTAKITVASSAPSSPATGDLWVDTT